MAQEGAPRNAVLSIFVANVVFLDCLMDFWWIFDEKSMKQQTCFFSQPRVLFSNWRPPTKHYILRYESYFFIFCVFAFFSKKTSKNVLRNRDHVFPSKITQKSSPGTRFGTQNGPELTSGRSKNRKMWQKSRFWTQ